MGKIILKGVLGLVIGVLVYSAAAASAGGGNVLALLLLVLWGIGFVYAFLPVMGWIKGVLNATLKITVISFLSCGTGILGLLLLIILLMGILAVGWIYGMYLMVKDILAL